MTFLSPKFGSKEHTKRIIDRCPNNAADRAFIHSMEICRFLVRIAENLREVGGRNIEEVIFQSRGLHGMYSFLERRGSTDSPQQLVVMLNRIPMSHDARG